MLDIFKNWYRRYLFEEESVLLLVTLPVVMVGFFQWGMSTEFFYLFAVYLLIQVLDGNVLVPLLFSEVVDLHPVAIILAVLFFGGIWGLWGFFSPSRWLR